ncbi:NAD-dependent epimerase/dehydratase family protein [Flammeovirgaceae bacterium SG7u.111]|nr:NAD-dependent epimerase/dehydratase family protein [Flammeovirgaceae bacterium SG7u.132]WPO35170.1 NAD-dependent epimerase/dehydratase family protein [Flammeovirgaceae bacterium SG7u.111]
MTDIKKDVVLITGAGGQLGSELANGLIEIYGKEHVISTDLRIPEAETEHLFLELDVMDKKRLGDLIRTYRVTQVYHLAAILSAKGESNPLLSWQINMEGLLNILEAAREFQLKVYWPSSIATFGANTPSNPTPQFTITEPGTVYGISKHAGELWCQYYHEKFGVDVRSLRYPGLIGYKSLPGGGTTDYAVDIFHKAIKGGDFTCFLKENTVLPMMYMPDAVRATLELMHADANKITVRTSYNIQAMSFSPKEIYGKIKKHYPEFEMDYAPDFRQKIAETWPQKLEDTLAQKDWGWKPEFDLPAMVDDMLLNLKKRVNYKSKVLEEI